MKIRNPFDKAYNYFLKKYLDKHLRVSMVTTVITDLEMTTTMSENRSVLIQKRIDDMQAALVKQIMRDGGIIMHREKDPNLGAEKIRMQVTYWI